VTRKALCSLGLGPHAELLAVSRPTFAAYAARHGYELVIPKRLEVERPPAWAKVKLLRRLLDDYDVLVWLDADAVIVEGSADIAQALGADREIGLVGHRRDDQLVPNSGVMVLRAGAVARALLEQMWSARHLIDHPWWENAALCEALGYSLPGSLADGVRGRFYRVLWRLSGRELRPFRQARESPFMARTQFLSNEWNSIHGDPAEHPRIVHFLGSPLQERLASMKEAVATTAKAPL